MYQTGSVNCDLGVLNSVPTERQQHKYRRERDFDFCIPSFKQGWIKQLDMEFKTRNHKKEDKVLKTVCTQSK